MARQLVHTGRKIRVYLETEETSSGAVVQRDLIQHPGAVAVLPLLDDGRVCLLRNRRPNVGDTLIEIPAGTLEPGEAPDLAAARELAEETGYTAANWQKLCEFYPSPGVLDERLHVYVAFNLTPGPMRPELDEDLEPQVVAWQDCLAWTLDGTIRDAKTLVAVLMWESVKGSGFRVQGSVPRIPDP